MTENKLKHYKPLGLLLIFLAIWWIVPVFIKSFLRLSFYSFQAPLWVATQHMRDIQDYWILKNHSKKEILEVARDLSRLNAAYEVALQESSMLKAELNNLEKLFNLAPTHHYRYEVARVIQRHNNVWWQQLIIQKGSKHGIKEGNGVIFSGGVVGRISQVFSSTAVVQLLTSPTFRIVAQLETDTRTLVYQGASAYMREKLQGSAQKVPLDLANNNLPLRLVTSRLGGTFPDGLTIGWLNHLEPELNGLFAKGKVALDPRLNSLREVTVLIKEDE